MKIERLITLRETHDITIETILPLSKPEYEIYKDRIPHYDGCWWLRTPADHAPGNAFFVTINGHVVDIEASNPGIGIRPSVSFKQTGSTLHVGDKFEAMERTWTVIGGGIAICDDLIGSCAYKRWKNAGTPCHYDSSDLKQKTDDWYAKQQMKQARRGQVA